MKFLFSCGGTMKFMAFECKTWQGETRLLFKTDLSIYRVVKMLWILLPVGTCLLVTILYKYDGFYYVKTEQYFEKRFERKTGQNGKKA